ncbi:MAG: amidohydrolase [Bacteroidetes bacterium]|nr:amidohydrolase [Bacteroidota bacterium]
MNKLTTTLLIALLLLIGLTGSPVQGQQSPSPKGSFLLLGAVAHLGNGQVIENSAIGVRDGRFTLVADATVIRINPAEYDTVITGTGQHVYPGFIAAVSGLGLIEIGAVRATNDASEVGDYNPHIRSSIAFNTDSKVLPTLRNNGILIAQVIPSGGTISGFSSVVHLNGWNWEDALMAEDDALHLHWQQLLSREGWWVENARLESNEKYHTNTDKLYAFFEEARAYAQNPSPAPVNLRFEAMKGIFDGSKKVFIRCYEAKEIAEAVRFGEAFGLDYVLVDAGQAWQVTDLLKQYDVPVILEQTHRLPPYGHSDVDQPFKTPALLKAAGVRFGLSVGSGWDAFWQTRNLSYHAGQAVPFGLDPEVAVASITGNLAEILGLEARCGTLTSGLEATFLLSEGDVLDMRTSRITHAWIQGQAVDLDDHQRVLYRRYMSKYGLE